MTRVFINALDASNLQETARATSTIAMAKRKDVVESDEEEAIETPSDSEEERPKKKAKVISLADYQCLC